MILRHILSFILPSSALIIIPLCIEREFYPRGDWTTIIGIMIIGVGLSIMFITIRMFFKIGNGTLAPWDPTRRLVTTGLYAHVRNPMISGVILVLSGEVFLFNSISIGVWGILFFVINTVYIRFSEERGLEKRFGDEYLTYKKNVPRWIPRVKPWSPGD